MNRSLLGVSVLLVVLVMLPLAPAFAGDGVAPGAQTAPGPDSLFTGSCKKSANIDFAVADDTGNTTSSTAFVPVPGMSVTFNLGRGGTCVKVEYSAFVFATTGGTALMFVRAFNVTSGVECLPGSVQFSGDDDEDADGKWARSHAFNFVCTGLSPGTWTIRIEWASFDGGAIFTHKRSMFVHHK